MDQTAKMEIETPEMAIRREARENGFDLREPLKTKDGDSVRVLGIDKDRPHGFPIIGEITEEQAHSRMNPLGQPLTRIARFNVYGAIQAKTIAACGKHSLQKNIIKFRRSYPLWNKGMLLNALLPTSPTIGSFYEMIFDEMVNNQNSSLRKATPPTGTVASEPVHDEPAPKKNAGILDELKQAVALVNQWEEKGYKVNSITITPTGLNVDYGWK